jgi:hypothetical protein
MIPRLQARGTSFKGSCTYVLHDPKAKTRDRVAWVLTQNLHSDPDQAWFEMFETCRNQDALKANAGVSRRGRKNTAPVLHYTLAWHVDDKPTPDEMRAAALVSLKVLELEQHESLIVAHNDKQHPHVHIVVNTVHPYTGRTAALKYSKERLSEWAETFERERGQIRCEDRVKNNEQRRDIREQRQEERLNATFASASERHEQQATPYQPIKDQSPNRPQWFEKKEITDRMKRLRAELDLWHKVERGITWQRQRRERDALDANTKAAIDNARAHVKDRFRPQWRNLYKIQKREARLVATSTLHPLDRAIFIFKNRERLGHGKPLSIGSMAKFLVSTKQLGRALQRLHERERRHLAREEKAAHKQLSERIWGAHRARFDTMRDCQLSERDSEREHQREASREITFERAKAHLIHEIENPPPTRPMPPRPKREIPEPAQEFNVAAAPPPSPDATSRAEQIRRDMEAWRRNNPNRDHGREL